MFGVIGQGFERYVKVESFGRVGWMGISYARSNFPAFMLWRTHYPMLPTTAKKETFYQGGSHGG